MKTFDRYVLKNVFWTTVLIALVLAVVVLLTQSLRFLELVINAGADGLSFWVLTLLALPRFFEVILPLSLLGAILFVYNRMSMDSEIVVIRSGGYSAMRIARPALVLGIVIMFILWGVTMWGAPKALSNMTQMRQMIKAQISTYLFREGIFNQVSDDLVLYVRERDLSGELRGLMIYDEGGRLQTGSMSDESTAKKGKDKPPPAIILARRGQIVAGDGEGHQIVVYDGSHQIFDPETRSLQKLSFEKYTVDFPDSSPVRVRWRGPDERTIFQLLNPDPDVKRDREAARDFRVEIHRRIITPLLSVVFALIGTAALTIGPFNRRGHGRRIVFAVVAAGLIQSLVLVGYNIARQSDLGLWLLYLVIFVPLFAGVFIMGPWGERVRRAWLYKTQDRRIAEQSVEGASLS